MPELGYHVYGVRLSLLSSCSGLLEEFRYTQLPPSWSPLARDDAAEHTFRLTLKPDGSWLIHHNQRLKSRGSTREALLRTAGNFVHLCLGEFATPEVFLHAAVVVLGGRAIVLPGRSRSGKSSLALALTELPGAVLYSDDFAILQGGRVAAYPIPLSQRQFQGPPREIPARQLGWHEGAEPVPVALVACARYRPGSIWRPRQVAPGGAVLELLRHTLGARRNPEQTLGAIAQLAATSPVYLGKRGETSQFLDWLRDIPNQVCSRAASDSLEIHG